MTGNKRAMGTYIVEMAVLVLFFGVCFWGMRNNAGQTSKRSDRILLDSGWEITTSGETTYYDKLPTAVKTSDNNTIWLSRKIGDVTDDNNAVGIFSFQKIVHAYIDGEKVLSFENNTAAHSKMPGNSWLFVDLHPQDIGKTLTLELQQCYGSGQVMVPVMYAGTVEGITNSYMKEKLMLICFSAIGSAIGLIIIVLWIVAGRSLMLSSGLPWLGMFAVVRGIWSLLEANFYSFYVDHLLLWVWMSYICLKTSIVPFAVFTNITFHEGRSKCLSIITWFALADTVITTLLQLWGIADYADTVLPTNLMIMVLGMYVVVIGVRNMYRSWKTKAWTYNEGKRMTYIAHTVFMFVLVIMSMVDVYRFYFTNTPDIALYSRVGYFVYVVAVLMALIWDFARLVSIGKQAENIKEEAAVDPMTKLYNRAAFEKHMDSCVGKKCENKAIIMFDLNNLKLFNDRLGHDMGDYYIKISSEIIRDMFGKYGSIYRIGGDEFCGIVEKINYGEFKSVKKEMEQHIDKLRIPGCDLKMGIASGCCIYDFDKDQSLRDTMKRADVDMYNNKLILKKGAEIR
ncbi:MAG: GGDEF domain-containing protein [Lachnospiraceae bacterium]|nr:GGDEF domain-containing protein [Lachnospiraceae bacterium]